MAHVCGKAYLYSYYTSINSDFDFNMYFSLYATIISHVLHVVVIQEKNKCTTREYFAVQLQKAGICK